MDFSIRGILAKAYPAAVTSLLNGRTWMAQEMEDMFVYAPQQVQLRRVGVAVFDEDDVSYPLEHCTIPLLWDVANNSLPMAERICFVKNLIMDGLKATDQYLLAQKGDGRLVVAEQARYILGGVTDSGAARIMTVYARVPQRSIAANVVG